MPQLPVNRKIGLGVCFRPWPGLPVGAALLLAGSFLYVWLRIEPVLDYHAYGPYFYRQQSFFQPFLHRPGGLGEYAGLFLAQLNCLNWLGALAFVLAQCGILLASLLCLAGISGRAPGLVALVPPLVLLLLRNRYNYPVPTLSIGVFLALAASAANAWLPWRRPWLAAAVSGLISALLFYLAGLWGALLFAVLSCWFVFKQMRSLAAGIGCLVLALAAPLVVVGAGDFEVVKLADPWPEGFDWMLAAALYASAPVAGAVLAWLPRPAIGPPAGLQPVLPESAAPTARSQAVGAVRPSQRAVALALGIGCAAIWGTFDRRQKLLAEIDYDAGCGQYEAVLAAARQVKSLDHPADVRMHLALYHTGRLAEDLFSFHNMLDDEPIEAGGEDWRAESRPLFELGLINDAEHLAHEALETEGDRPDLLRLLAEINLLKNRPQAAQVFLNVLSLIPFQGERADEAWPMGTPQLPASERSFLDGLRARVLTNEVPHEGLPVGPLLDVLLASNPTNQMAFEYLMAYYLMDLDLDKAVARLRLLDHFHYPRIPRSYAEALLLDEQLTGVQVPLKGCEVGSETAARFRQFLETARRSKSGAEARAALAAKFSDTYWYYYFTARDRRQAAQGQSAAP